jgi:Tfp pilus assembly protein PilE
MSVTEVKAHEEKISAQLHEAKALLEEFEAHARKNKAQAEIEKITGLKTKQQEIEKKLQQLAKTGIAAKAAVQIKADIEAEVAKLKTSLGEIATRIKSNASTN